ncbi:MAG TPA: hypothetical protein VN581_11155 [Patescibacteria group bacterium]|nr:hypothetical protein [Patescibacteria group bacterium]
MRLRLRALPLFALMCFTHASYAQNLLTNPDLTTDDAGWLKSTSTSSSLAFWDNARGYPTPGSAALNANAIGDSPSFSQCLNISPQNVDLVAWTKLRYAGGPQFMQTIGFSTFGVPNCSATYLQFMEASPTGTVIDGWKEHRLMNVALPAETQSVRVFLILTATESSVGINIDHVAFGPAGTVVPSETVFINGFE